MNNNLKIPIYECGLAYFKKKYLNFKIIMICGFIPIIIFLIFDVVQIIVHNAYNYFSSIILGIFLMIFTWYFVTHVLLIEENYPFGIYEDGISPPCKPLTWNYSNYYLKYNEIKDIELKNPWIGNKFQEESFKFKFHTIEKNPLVVSIYDFLSHERNPNELKRIYEILVKVRNELRNEKMKNKINEEIIMEKELFDDILKKEYNMEQDIKILESNPYLRGDLLLFFSPFFLAFGIVMYQFRNLMIILMLSIIFIIIGIILMINGLIIQHNLYKMEIEKNKNNIMKDEEDLEW